MPERTQIPQEGIVPLGAGLDHAVRLARETLRQRGLSEEQIDALLKRGRHDGPLDR